MLELKFLVIHELIKERFVTKCDYFLSDSVLNSDGSNIELCTELHSSFNQDNYVSASISDSNNEFNDYLKRIVTRYDKKKMLEFTRTYTMKLADQIKNVPGAIGGYILYGIYKIDNKDYFSIYLLRNNKGKLFRRNANVIEVRDIKYLNTEKLAMACNINMQRYNDNHEKPLRFISKKRDEVSGFFYKWIGIKEIENSKEYTEKFREIIENIDPPINPETNEPYSREVWQKKAADFVKTQNKTINLREISKHFYDDSEKLPNFASDNGIEIDNEFRAHSKELYKLIKHFIKSGSIELKYSVGDKKEQIIRTDGNKLIIESEELVQLFNEN